MSWLSPFRKTRTTPARRAAQARPRSRPQLECLEERTLLNNRFVVPVGAPVDNTTTFATLQQALTTAGLASGDTIQIQQGSSPGNITAANLTTALTAAPTLTIQGDPSATAASIPQFTLDSAATTAAGTTLNLKNVNLGLITTGSLTFNGTGNITNSFLVEANSSAGFMITFAPGAASNVVDTLSNSTLLNAGGTGSPYMVTVTPGTGTGDVNTISGNLFQANAQTTDLIDYTSATPVAVTDQVVNNTLVSSAASTNTYEIAVGRNAPVAITGLTIKGNSLTNLDAVAADNNRGIDLEGTTQNTQVVGNTINMAGTGRAIVLTGGGAATTTSATISANLLNAGPNGTGLSIIVSGGTLNTSVQGNDFHGNKIGVNISAGANTVTGIDLGGGNQGSLGDNNFRSFTAAATATSGAIVTNATTGTIQAQNNIFAVANPQTVISATAGATVNATALSANAAYVAVIYNEFLQRPGNTTNAADAGGFVNLLNGGTNSLAGASSLIRSPESLGVIVNGLYLKIFNRAADTGGQQFFVGLFQQNFTIEQVITIMVTTTEFANQAGSDGGFVLSLYTNFLGRTANAGEVSFWVSLIGTPGVGRAGVAKVILGSAEFRGDVIQAVYGFTSGTPGNLPPTSSVVSILPNMLHRTTAAGAGELAFWQNLPLDIGNEVVIIASSPEFFNNG